jgi:hypothetical protein
MASIFCRVLGVVFVIVGIWGFVAGHQVLVFDVNPLHNVVHLITGALALWFGYTSERAARTFSLIFGGVYGLVAILGFAGVDSVVELLHLNRPDDWLHLLIAAVFILGALLPREMAERWHLLPHVHDDRAHPKPM